MSQAFGTIVQTIGAVIDIEFPRDAMPHIYDALVLEDSGSTLAEKGITTRDALADLSVDELTELTALPAERAQDLIMKARAHWFE